MSFFADTVVDAWHLLIQGYSSLLLPAFMAYVTTKGTYPFFLRALQLIPRLGRDDSKPCIGCVIACYLGNMVILTLLLIWLLLAFPQLRPPS